MTEVREAAKAVLWTPDHQRILTATTRKGVVNFLGGGIDKGETPIQALRREVEREETPKSFIVSLSNEQIGGVWGEISPDADGNPREGLWYLFTGEVHIPWFNPIWTRPLGLVALNQSGLVAPQFEIPESQDHISMQLQTPEEFLSLPNASELAKEGLILDMNVRRLRSIGSVPRLLEPDEYQRLAG